MSGFHQLESSLASHSITYFKLKREKDVTGYCFLGYIPPSRNYIMIFWPILRKDFIAIRLEWYYTKPQEMFIF